MKTLLVFGYGYSAASLGKLLLNEGWRVIGTTRSTEKADRLREDGIEAIVWPGADVTDAINAATHILLSAAPNEAGDPVYNALSKSIANKIGELEWLGYLSTTGVYGDHKGGWVDENTPLTPSTKRGEMRVRAEANWQNFCIEQNIPLHIFRLAGIYGPGRGPFAKVRSGSARRIIKEGQVFSRIHVTDIAAVLRASIQQPRSGAVYNVCDNDPAPPEDVIAYAAELLGVPVPPDVPIEDADLSPMARSFYAESKRVSNQLIHDELNISLKYPNYKNGLQALLQMEDF